MRPVRDMFAAIFFVSVGGLIDPAIIARHWGAVLVFSAVVIVGKVLFVSISSFLIGYSPRTSVQAGRASPRSASSRSSLPPSGCRPARHATFSTPSPSPSRPSRR